MAKYRINSNLYNKALSDCENSINSPEIGIIAFRINELLEAIPNSEDVDIIWGEILEWLKLQRSYAALEPRVTKQQLAIYTAGVARLLTKYVQTDDLTVALGELEQYVKEVNQT